MTYDASLVSDSVIAHKKPVTIQLLRALRDNMESIAAGDPGATRIAEAALDASPVNRTALKTGTGSVSYSFSSGGGSVSISLDAYCFLPAADGNASGFSLSIGGADADSPFVKVSASDSASGNVFWRYVLP